MSCELIFEKYELGFMHCRTVDLSISAGFPIDKALLVFLIFMRQFMHSRCEYYADCSTHIYIYSFASVSVS